MNAVNTTNTNCENGSSTFPRRTTGVPNLQDVSGPISRPFGPGTVTVTPLTARRLKAPAPNSQQRAIEHDDVIMTSLISSTTGNTPDEVTESKATVYDNVQMLSV